MTYEEICNILVKKKLSGQEKLDLVKDEILKNAEMINTLSPLKKFEYTNIVGLSILYAPEVFNFIQKNDLHINYSLITKNKESLLHLATRSKYQYEFIDKILPNNLKNINKKDIEGSTPLLNSIKTFFGNDNKERNRNIINLLLKSGPQADFRNDFKNDLENPLYLAVSSHDYETVDILLKNGMNINTLIDEKPLALYIYNEGKYNDCFKMVNFLISRGYDYTVFNNNDEWKINLFEKAQSSKNDLMLFSNILMEQGVHFNFDHKSIMQLFDKLKKGNLYIDLIKLFENMKIDYTLTADNINVLSLIFNSIPDENKSREAIDYLIKENIKIDLDVMSLSNHTFNHLGMGKGFSRCHFIEILLDCYCDKDDMVNVLSFIEKNIRKKEDKIKINLGHMDENIFLKFKDSREFYLILEKLFDKISITTCYYVNNLQDINNPLIKLLMDKNHEVKLYYVNDLFDELLKNVKNKIKGLNIFLVEDQLKRSYMESSLKAYLSNSIKNGETEIFTDLLSKLNEDNKLYNTSNIVLKSSLMTLIEQDILNNVLVKKPLSTNNVVKKRF